MKLACAVKLVVDTNLLISGTLWHGAASRLLNAILLMPGTLCLSADIIFEFGEVLARPKFAARLTEQGVTISHILMRFQRLSRRVVAAEVTRPHDLRDPKDLKILAAAVGGGADAIVSGDNDLLALKSFEGIPIITVEEALEKLGFPAE